MMRHETEREKMLWEEYDRTDCSKERKREILKELNEIDKNEKGLFA